jgi:hypothetical protein
MFRRSQLNRSRNDVSLIKMFRIVSMKKWFESWFKFNRVLQIKIRSLRFSVVKHMSMIDSDLWKWKYVDVFLKRLDCNRNSFINNSISNDLLFDRIVKSFQNEWWMLRFFIMMWFLKCSFDDDFSRTKRRFCRTKDDKIFDSLHYVFRAKQILQIINKNTLDDERAYSNKILFRLDLTRIEQEMIVF